MVSLRDGKTYDPSAEGVSSGTSRRRSTATANPASAQRATRRSTRLASSTAEPEDSNVPFQSQEEPATPLTRGKRQRPQHLTAVQEPPAAAAGAAAADEEDSLDAPDVDSTDQGLQLREAAAVALPADEPSPTPSAKKPRIPATTRTPTPSKAAAAAAKQRRETVSVSIAAAVMVLVAALAMAALLPGLAPHRDQLKGSILRTAAHTNDAYLQPLRLQALDSFTAAKTQITAASAAAQQQAQAALLQAQQRWGHLLPAGLRDLARADSAPESAGTWSVDVLSSILPDSQQWAAVAADIADMLQTPPAQRNHKAPAMLLACGSDDDCDEAAAALSVLPPKGEACSLVINSPDLRVSGQDSASQPAAALQALLAPFLQRCPAGMVVLRGVEALPPAAVPALHNALSELGGFQHNGKVDAYRAAYALLLKSAPTAVAGAVAAPDSATMGTNIKQTFIRMLRSQVPEKSAHWEGVERALSTLHRRIEFAAPVRLGTSTEAALDAARGAAAAAAA